jgi:HPt (histidine-containing phosphotransfer) domain-containing protein
LEKAGNHGLDARDHRDTLRILHTIKSAASVIPLPQVTDTTHLAESIVEHTAADPARWPDEVMQRYARCLREITNSRADLEAMLSELASLVPELNDAIGEPCG